MPPQPEPPTLPEIRQPKFEEVPRPPERKDIVISLSFLQKLIPALRENAKRRAHEDAERRYSAEHEKWQADATAIRTANDACWHAYERKKSDQLTSDEYLAYTKAHDHWQQQSVLLEQEYQSAAATWRAAKQKFEAAEENERSAVIELRNRYLASDRQAVEAVIQLTLEKSPYPQSFPRNIETHYNPENRIVLLNFQLPDFHRVAILTHDRKLGERQRTQAQETALYSIAIRTLYEAIFSDEINAFDSVVFNGWVDYVDGATGQARQAYILSVHATKPQIAELNIAHVNPLECFRSLKGLAAARISAYTPVAPLLTFDKKDDRLVEGRKVIEGLSAGDNLAAMDWDDFEHLIRELFEKVFSAPGVDVRITRASRDRGVDAIIYDPDPIRGGRYIIQAKKYTNLVDVAAVRDLFGTVQAEKANRGILVTTSHFGPDAHEFAKDKNITLIEGPELLHLFEKHGYTFRIDLKEARKLLGLT